MPRGCGSRFESPGRFEVCFVELCSLERPSAKWLTPGNVRLPERLQADGFLFQIEFSGQASASALAVKPWFYERIF
jgi:hypothetical protein